MLSYLSLLFFGTLHSNGYIFPFLLCFSHLFFSQLFVRPPQTAILLFCISFSYWIIPWLLRKMHFPHLVRYYLGPSQAFSWVPSPSDVNTLCLFLCCVFLSRLLACKLYEGWSGYVLFTAVSSALKLMPGNSLGSQSVVQYQSYFLLYSICKVCIILKNRVEHDQGRMKKLWDNYFLNYWVLIIFIEVLKSFMEYLAKNRSTKNRCNCSVVRIWVHTLGNS